MSNIDYFKSALSLASFGSLIMAGAWLKIKRRNKVKDTVKQVISSASAGSVELEAIAWPLSTPDKCLQGEDCVFRSWELQEINNSSNKRGHWKTIWTLQTPHPFLAFDHTGFLKIFPLSKDDLEVHKEIIYYPRKLNQSQKEAFKKHCEFSHIFPTGFFGFLTAMSFRIIEKKILVGSPLLIHGHLNPADKIIFLSQEEMLSEFRQKACLLMNGKNFRMKMLDKDQNGEINIKELQGGFKNLFKRTSRQNFCLPQFSESGKSECRFYGDITGTSKHPLTLADAFEEQYLSSVSALFPWILFMIGGIIFLLGLYQFVFMFKE